MKKERIYIAIDLKSFYASVECVERSLDPLNTNLVVADESRTEKTICLAVSPSLKAYGIPGRARLFEVNQKVKEVNARRLALAPEHKFTGKSSLASQLVADPSIELDFIIARPQMGHYMEFSSRIFNIYMKYIAPEDIHVYSIDEVFIDATDYVPASGLSPRDFAMRMILDVLSNTGITATAGIGSNLYLSKIAMDVEAKRIPADENGVRIAQLDEQSYREKLWDHRPLTDFWRVGKGYAGKLEKNGMFTMGDIALRSVYDEETLYRLFGVNAELLIDHAWGYENCTIADIKSYRPESSSISSGQVLQSPYSFEKGRLIAREMTDLLVLELVDKKLLTDQMVLTVGYDIESLALGEDGAYSGPVTDDFYGRRVPKPAHGSINLPCLTSSTRLITDAVLELYDRIVDKKLLVRRMYVVANRLTAEGEAPSAAPEQMDLFTDYEITDTQKRQDEAAMKRERSRQQAIIDIKKKYGKNAILKGMNFEEGATTRERNRQVGGHRE